MKPGYKTTEFYVTVATIVGSLVTAISGGLPADWAASVSGGLAAAYAIARAVAKVGEAFAKGAGVSK